MTTTTKTAATEGRILITFGARNVGTFWQAQVSDDGCVSTVGRSYSRAGALELAEQSAREVADRYIGDWTVEIQAA